MKYRKLRIAWSVAWGILCLLLIALWLRSYAWLDDLGISKGKRGYITFQSYQGRIHMNTAHSIFGNNQQVFRSSRHILGIDFHLIRVKPNGSTVTERRSGTAIPAWCFLVLLVSISGAPWLPWIPRRFSLRTLLIGMTLAAVGLGWLVYALRK